MSAATWVRLDDGREHLLQKSHRDRDGVTLTAVCGRVSGPHVGPVFGDTCPKCEALAAPIDSETVR